MKEKSLKFEILIKSPKKIILMIFSCAGWFDFSHLWLPYKFGGGGIKMVWGLSLNPIGKILDSIVNCFNLKIDNDNDIGLSESYFDFTGKHRVC